MLGPLEFELGRRGQASIGLTLQNLCHMPSWVWNLREAKPVGLTTPHKTTQLLLFRADIPTSEIR